MKAYTDLNQSKKLAEFLPLESADFVWLIGHLHTDGPRYEVIRAKGEVSEPENYWHCWSLAALLELLPYEIVLDEDESLILGIHKEDFQYFINYDNTYNGEIYFETLLYDDFVDACYEIIIKLHEQKIL